MSSRLFVFFSLCKSLSINDLRGRVGSTPATRWRLTTYNFSFCFNPDFSSAWQRFVWRVNNFTRCVYSNGLAVSVILVVFNCKHRFSVASFGITPNLVLVYMNAGFHAGVPIKTIPATTAKPASIVRIDHPTAIRTNFIVSIIFVSF